MMENVQGLIWGIFALKYFGSDFPVNEWEMATDFALLPKKKMQRTSRYEKIRQQSFLIWNSCVRCSTF